MVMRVARGVLPVAAVLLMGTLPAPAEELGWLGVHAAYYNEYDKGAIGLNARETFGVSPWSVGLKGDYVFRSNLINWVVETDLQYEVPIETKKLKLSAWAGAGAGLLHQDPYGPAQATYDPIVTGFVGVGLPRGPLLPYIEVRLQSHEVARWVVYAGLRF
jgi:hypothetical protein